MPRIGGNSAHQDTKQAHHSFQVMPPYGGNGKAPMTQSAPPGVSSHAPVWGQRPKMPSGVPLLCFKSCPRMGATLTGCLARGRPVVSSHAPVWGQLGRDRLADILAVFQVMPPYGGNITYDTDKKAQVTFQVMPPYGGNGRDRSGAAGQVRFKSCPRMGATKMKPQE